MIFVVMGVSGCGKTTVGRALADSLGWQFADADTYHSPENIAKMSRGEALTDADRASWLARLAELLAQSAAQGGRLVLACSALKQAYRRTLAGGAGYRLVWLHGTRERLRERLESRRGHFFGASMLDSQLAALEAPTDALVVDIDLPVDQQLAQIRSHWGLV